MASQQRHSKKRAASHHGARPSIKPDTPNGKDFSVKNHSSPSTPIEDTPIKSKRRVTKSSSASSPSATASSPPSTTNSLSITEVTGDIFDAPNNTLLIHACNCMGSWGAGIAAAFKTRYPKAFAVYHAHCAAVPNDSNSDLVGTALLIPPCEEDPAAPRHWVGCLFTSRSFGKRRDSPEQIVQNTGPAVHALMEAVAELEPGVIREVRMCRINAGKFGVPWEETKAAIAELVFGDESIPSEIVVYEREE